MSLLHLMLRLGTRSKQAVAMTVGGRIPLHIVSEYPKSGGTWFSQMLAAYLDVPLPKMTYTPSFRECVIHNHWGYSSRYQRPIYVLRDGRDLCVSMFFHLVRVTEEKKPALLKYVYSRIPDWDEISRDSEGNICLKPEFVNRWVQSPIGVKTTWAQHVGGWWGHDGVCYVKYEDLLSSPEPELERAIKFCTGQERVVTHKLRDVIDQFSFAKQTGRQPGEEDHTSFIRKGISGDWKNHFCVESCKRFEAHAGQTLRDLGYETHSHWWEEFAETGS
ncbi:sulfotransferase domain-containing protein [Rubripirellula amarantea]|nr:sulfotransferase domain-containing protein [Rubripirellula amarantea]